MPTVGGGWSSGCWSPRPPDFGSQGRPHWGRCGGARTASRTGFHPRPLSTGERARLRYGVAGTRGKARPPSRTRSASAYRCSARRHRGGPEDCADRCAHGDHGQSRRYLSAPSCRPGRDPKRQSGALGRTPAGGTGVRAGRERLDRLHAELMARWASPGGSADLLGVTLFLDRLEGGAPSVTEEPVMETLNFEYEASGR